MPPVSSRTTTRSTPSSTSRRSGEEATSSGTVHTGRRLATDAEALAEPEQRLLRPDRRAGIVPLRPADGAEQDGVGRPRARQLGGGQRLARRVDGGTADDPGGELEREPVSGCDRLQNGDRLRRHLGTDAVAGEDGDRRTGCHAQSSAPALGEPAVGPPGSPAAGIIPVWRA